MIQYRFLKVCSFVVVYIVKGLQALKRFSSLGACGPKLWYEKLFAKRHWFLIILT